MFVLTHFIITFSTIKVQDDLHHLKEQIISQGVSTEVIDLRTLQSAIERTEQSVRVSVKSFTVPDRY